MAKENNEFNGRMLQSGKEFACLKYQKLERKNSPPASRERKE